MVAIHPFVLRGASWAAAAPVTGQGSLPVPWGELDIDLTALDG